MVSSHVLTLKHEVKQWHITWKQLFQLLQETNSCFQVIWRCLTSCFGVVTLADMTEGSASFLSFKTIVYSPFQRIVGVPMHLHYFSWR